MNNRQQLSVLSLQQQNILKKYSRKQSAKGIDIHKLIGKLPKPKAGFVLPRYRYVGPYNPLEEQLNEDDTPKADHLPVNKLDEIAMHHDICTRDSKNLSDKHKCDRKMLDEMKQSKSKTWKEAIDKKLVQGVIGTKYHLGLGVNQKKNHR